MPCPELGVNLTAARVAAGLSREIVAVRLEKSYSTVVGYERGVTSPPIPVLVRLANLYHVPVGALFGDSAVPNVA